MADKKGTLRIETNPTNAHVSVNNQSIDAVTSLDIVDVDPGQYNVTLAFGDYQPYNFDIEVFEDKISYIKYDFVTKEVNEDFIDITTGESDKEKDITEPYKPTDSEILAEHLQKMNDILERSVAAIERGNESVDLVRQYLGKQYGFDSEQAYFSTGLTAVSTSTPNKPESSDTIAPNGPGGTGYDRIEVFNVIQRNARDISFINNGSQTIFVLVSHNGVNFGTQEIQVLQGEIKHFFNVYELRIRCPVIGNLADVSSSEPGGIYLVSEYTSQFNTNNINRPAIFVTSATVLVLGAGFTTFTITGPIINLTSVFRASVLNTDNVYFTYQGGDITNVNQRGTLAPGDKMQLNVTQGTQVTFAGAIAGQIVELITETGISYA